MHAAQRGGRQNEATLAPGFKRSRAATAQPTITTSAAEVQHHLHSSNSPHYFSLSGSRVSLCTRLVHDMCVCSDHLEVHATMFTFPDTYFEGKPGEHVFFVFQRHTHSSFREPRQRGGGVGTKTKSKQ